jgi:hypothetical protein
MALSIVEWNFVMVAIKIGQNKLILCKPWDGRRQLLWLIKRGMSMRAVAGAGWHSLSKVEIGNSDFGAEFLLNSYSNIVIGR